ncbi:type II toxin-antitoxin system RelE/ParE family toxin [Oxalobacteraceae bacterium A2-2]
MKQEPKARVFKTRWFTKAAIKRGIADHELCAAIEHIRKGKADDLGGGVWKKRLNQNRDRAIVLAKGRRNWILVYLFQKQDRENIQRDELEIFRRLAADYERMSEDSLEQAIANKDLTEICHE